MRMPSGRHGDMAGSGPAACGGRAAGSGREGRDGHAAGGGREGRGGRRGVAGAGAYAKDVARTVRGTLKRFSALATICALGITMLVGLKVSCVDLRRSADAFFDEQGLFDVRVQSTLGLDDADVAALSGVEGVLRAEGGWSETAYVDAGGSAERVEVRALSDGLNAPRVLEGHLPTRDDQVAVTRRFLDETGLCLGDTVVLRDDGTVAVAVGDVADADSDVAAGGSDVAGAGGDVAAGDGEAEAAGSDAAASAELPPVFRRGEYTIIASVLDPMDVNAGEGTMSFRNSGGADYTLFVRPSCVTEAARGSYTVAYLQVDGAAEPLCYSDDYRDAVDGVLAGVESLREGRESARGEGLRGDAHEQVDQAERDAQASLDEAQSQLDGARAQIDDGARALLDAHARLDAGQAQAEGALSQLAAALGCASDQVGATIAARRADLEAARGQLSSARSRLEATGSMLGSLPYVRDVWPSAAWQRLVSATTPEEARAAADEVQAAVGPFSSQASASLGELADYLASDEFAQALEKAQGAYDALPQAVRDRIERLVAEAPQAVRDVLRAVVSTSPAQAAAQVREMADMLSQLGFLAPGMVQVVEGEAQVREGAARLDEAARALAAVDAAQAQVADGRARAEASGRQLDDARAAADDAQAQLERGREEAGAQIRDAREAADAIPDATWYVQDRTSLPSYASVESDSSSIEVIGTVLPLVFFVVAVLVSLTTMTRMVEEERGLIGLYKALGYRRARIAAKYVTYALAACLVGAIVGCLLGYVVLPLILSTIFSTMYALPRFLVTFEPLHALEASALFVVGIVGATALTCRRELAETPASLMRPKAPKAGARILVERVRPLWSRMSFLHKVTARNLTRYKKRLLMTVLGVAGCTALLVCGFGIRDTVLSLPDRQYGESGVVSYDLLAVAAPGELPAVEAELLGVGAESSGGDDAAAGGDHAAAGGDAAAVGVRDAREVYVDSVTAEFGGRRESLQLLVVPDGTSLDGMLGLSRADGGAPVDLVAACEGDATAAGDEPAAGTVPGAVVTKSAEQVMGFSAGDELRLQDPTLATADVRVGDVCLSYLGNMAIMTQGAYERAFGRACGPNAVLALLDGDDAAQVDFAEGLSQDPRMLSVVSTAGLVRDFSSAFTLINTVVYVVIVMAAALAFTVVFTLSNTNISERERELATLKVLGFRPREVHGYINKETLILTGFGIAVGLPAGWLLTRSLTWVLKMPALYFDTVVSPMTYVVAALLALGFTLVVDVVTNRALDRVDMVGALKSAE